MLLAPEDIKQKQNERIDATEIDRWCYWSTECTAETRTFAYDWLLSSFWQNIKGFYDTHVKKIKKLLTWFCEMG